LAHTGGGGYGGSVPPPPKINELESENKDVYLFILINQYSINQYMMKR